MANTFTIETNINGNSKKIKVKPRLSLMEVYNFSRSVVEKVINEELGVVVCAWKDFAIKLTTLRYYTDLKLPDEIDAGYDFIYNNNVYEKIVGATDFDFDFYTCLIGSVEEQLDFEMQKIAKKSKLDEIYDWVLGLTKKFGDDFEPSKIAEALPMLANVGQLDEEKIVSTVLKLNDKKKKRRK